MRLRPVALDQQQVVAICLDVKVALTRETDDLHREVVDDAMVEDGFAVRLANLRALVADDRPVQPQPLYPRQRARKWTSRARDDLDAGCLDPRQRFGVARVEVQARVDDRAVQVEGEQAISSSAAYRLTSGLTRFGGRPPRTPVAMLRAAIADISERVRVVALAMCGASTTFGSTTRPGCTAGSRSYTSRPTPAIFLAFSASTRAASSTTGPREVLMRIAVFFIKANCGVLSRCCVSGVSGTCTETKSDSASSLPRSTRVAPSCCSASGGSGFGSWYSTRMLKPFARWATPRPMRPTPMSPNVAPNTSAPSIMSIAQPLN